MEFPVIPDLDAIPTGDMPGDKVQITQGHVDKAQSIFPACGSCSSRCSRTTAAPSSPSTAAPASASPRSVRCSRTT